MKKDTLLARAGRDPARHQGMVNTPVFRTSTVIFPDRASYEARGGDDYKKVRYGLYGTPTTFALEEAVAQMEGGHAAVALPSGLAALAVALWAFLKTGDHVLLPDSVYAPTRNFCDRRLQPNGIEIEYYDPLIGAGFEKLLRPNTRAVFCEAPGSLSFEMQDIPAIAAAAHARGLPVLADTTWGTPYFFRSFEKGVDVSIHAATKYIAGHSDVVMGMIVTNERHWLTVRRAVADYGYGVSPDDCYLTLRGFRTIGVRMNQQMANALKVARWLQSRREVKRVIYPALEGDPGTPCGSAISPARRPFFRSCWPRVTGTRRRSSMRSSFSASARAGAASRASRSSRRSRPTARRRSGIRAAPPSGCTSASRIRTTSSPTSSAALPPCKKRDP